MAEINDDVMAMIEKEIKAKPDVSNKDLKKKAERIDSSVSELSARQFNARYPLQVKRRLAPKKPRRSRKRSRKQSSTRSGASKGTGRRGDGRDSVRDVMLEFARDVAAADDKAQMVDVVAGVDRYVDRIMRAKG